MSGVTDRSPSPGAASEGRGIASGGSQASRSAADWLWRRWNDAELFSAPARLEWPVGLRRARIIGMVLLFVQLLVFGWWSTVLTGRYALSWDYSAYNQATYLIAHGHLDPFSTVFNLPFWKNNGEFIFWPLAIFERIWPHIITLKLLQDLAIVGAEAVAFLWICDIAARRAKRDDDLVPPLALVALGLLLLIANPWLVWTVSFDAHPEAFSVLFLIAAARDAYGGRRTAWIWILLAVACGSVPSSYVGALGLSLILSGKPWWKQGVALTLIGFGWLSALHGLDAAHGSSISGLYGPLLAAKDGALPQHASTGTLIKAAIQHPGRFASVLWLNKTDLFATIAPAGIIGLLWIPVLIPGLLILAEGGLTQGLGFAFPSFQNAAIAPLVAVGTVALCAILATWLKGRRRWLPKAVIGLVAANTIVWAAIWSPQASKRWLLVPSGASAVLARLHSQMKSSDEVIVEQGVAGGFSDRQALYTLVSPNIKVPLASRTVWFIFTPSVGIETAPVAGIYVDMREVAALPRATLVASSNGVWAFKWTPSPGRRSLTLGAPGFGRAASLGTPTWRYGLGLDENAAPVQSVAPGWTVAGIAGRSVTSGPPKTWHVVSNGRKGYVVDRAYWREPLGRYQAAVTLSASSTANVEVWDATATRLLGRDVVDDTHGRQTVRINIDLKRLVRPDLFGASALWAAVPKAPLRGDELEIRVWSPGDGDDDRISVYTAGMHVAT